MIKKYDKAYLKSRENEKNNSVNISPYLWLYENRL